MQTNLSRKQVDSNIKKVYIYSALAGLMLWHAVYSVFMLSKGLSFTQLSTIEAVFAGFVMLEIFGGAFADIVSRRVAVLLKALVITFAAVLFGLADTFFVFLLSNIIWGVGVALGAGAETALLYDSLKSVKREKEFLHIYGNCRVFGFFAGMIGALLGPYIYIFNVQLPFFIGAGVYALSGVLFFSAHEAPLKHSYSVKRHFFQIKTGVWYALKHPNVRWIALLGMFTALFFAFFGMIQTPFFLSAGFSMSDVGWILAFGMAVDALFAYNTERIHRFFGERFCFVLILASYAISSIAFGFVAGIPVIGFLFLQKFGTGFGTTFAEHYLQKHSQSGIRATVSSAEGFLSDVSILIGLPLLGWIVDVTSLKFSLIITGISLLIVGSVLIAVFPKDTHKVVW